jgi:hypothetical protein
MNGPENWTRQYLMERLIEILEYSSRSPEAVLRHGGRSLSDLALHGGGTLNLQDPAVMSLIEYASSAGQRNVRTVGDLFDVLKRGFLFVTDGKPKRPIDSLHRMFDLQRVGWNELDRLIRTLTREHVSFSDIVNPIQASFRLCPDDHGLDGDTCYALGYSVKLKHLEKVAFGSSPAFALKFIDDAIRAAESSHRRDNLIRSELALAVNGKGLFRVPLLPRVTVRGYQCSRWGAMSSQSENYADLTADWANVQWKDSRDDLMKILVNALPARDGHVVKGRFLEDDLGM